MAVGDKKKAVMQADIDTATLSNDSTRVPASSVVKSAIDSPPLTEYTSATIGITGITTSYVRAGVAFLKIYDFKPSSASGDFSGTLPTALRPNSAVNGVAISADGSNTVRISVSTAGVISFNGADTSRYHYGTIVYPVT